MSFIEEQEFEAECIGTAAGIGRHTVRRVSRGWDPSRGRVMTGEFGEEGF